MVIRNGKEINTEHGEILSNAHVFVPTLANVATYRKLSANSTPGFSAQDRSLILIGQLFDICCKRKAYNQINQIK